jgi:flagellar biosynthesis/type III secretory pathway M-ring protein FliF/YscJ
MLAMRPALYNRESRRPDETSGASAAPTEIAAPNTNCAADAAPTLATQVAQARRDARRDPAQVAMLLRAWMSEHG